MKHIFIINPAAGKGRSEKTFLPKIIETAKETGIDYEIHRTMAPGDADRFVRGHCDAEKEAGSGNSADENLIRFYACGGDGTLNEVVNGAYGFQNAEIAMIPAGTGNDFPRNFRNPKYFEDIRRQIQGRAKPIDIIRYTADVPGNSSESSPRDFDIYESCPDPVVRYGINMFNIGLDCNVVDKTAEIKMHPFLPGLLAYGLGVGIILLRKEGVNLELHFDDGEVLGGDIMLTAIGNGCFCGGGFKGVPEASLEDGLIDVSVVGNISRRKFLSLIVKYRKGTHLKDPAVTEFLTYKKCKSLKMIPSKPVKFCTDGEIMMVGETIFEIVTGGINFSVPQGCE